MKKFLNLFLVLALFGGVIAGGAVIHKKVSVDGVSQTASLTSPKISGVSITGLSSSEVTINWKTDVSTSGRNTIQVKKGWSGTWGSAFAGTSGTTHQAKANGLLPNTSYYYKITSCASGCNTYTGSSKFTTTNTAPDTTAPTAPTNLTSSNITQTSATVSWNASTDNVGVTGYEVFKNGTSLGVTPATNFSLTGLTGSTTYNISVTAKDGAGNSSSSSSISVITTTVIVQDTTAPSAPTNLALISHTDTSVSISWTASTDNVGVAGYEIFMNGASIGTNAGATSIGVASLSPSTNYIFEVRARDLAGNVSGFSNQLSVTTYTTPDTEKPSTPTNLVVSNILSNGADISWSASTDNVGVIEYQVYVNGTLVNGTVSATSIHISGLTENTTYVITVSAKDAANNYSLITSASTATFQTIINIPSTPTNLTLLSKTNTSAVFTWNASTDVTGTPNYEVYVNGTYIATTGTDPSIELTGLAASTSYSVYVKAKNSASHLSAQSNTVTFTTDATPDTQAPTAPTNLTSNNLTSTSVNIFWSASTDNVGVIEYQVYVNGFMVGGTASETSIALSGLSPSTTYSITIKAKDASNNLSPASTALSISTPGLPDTTAPTAPTNLASSNITQTSATVSWNASVDNIGVVGYNIYKNGSATESNSSLITGTSYPASGLTAGTSRTYAVRALDAAGNISPLSSSITVTTLSAADTTAPTISAISSTPNDIGVTITWTTNEVSDSQISYGTTSSYGSTSLLDTTLTTSHSVTVTGLTTSTLYHFKVTSKDASANSASSADQTFTTTTPVVTTTCANAITNPADARDVWAWHGLTELMTDGSTYQNNFFNYVDTHKVQTIYINSYPSFFSSSTNVANMKTFLNKAKAHCMEVEALGGAEDWIVTPGNPYIAPAAYQEDPGTNLPTDPKNLTVSNVGLTTATLSWTAPTDTSNFSGYNVYKSATNTSGTYSGTKVNSSVITGTTYNLTGLTQGKKYTYMVKKVDAGGAVSTTQASNIISFGMYTNEATEFATAVKNFNDSITGTNAKFSGIQYDVEPHTLSASDGYYPYYGLVDSTYTEPQANQKILNALIDTMQSVRAITGSSVKVTLAPPRWYDSSSQLNPFSRTGVGSTGKNAMQYLFDTVDTLAIQDYVNTASRIYNDAQGELSYAVSTGKKVKLGILLDYSSDAPTSTFYGSTCSTLNSTLQSAYNLMTASEKSAFAGFAIEQYDTGAGYTAGTPSSWTGMCP